MASTIGTVRAAIEAGTPPDSLIADAVGRAEADPTNAFTEVRSGTAAGTGPLAGVAVAVKDLINERGRITGAGSSFYRLAATESATVIDRLEAAGASVIGRTGLHEFAYGFSSENPWSGPVRNPWDLDRSPGGSSGGSAAAVGAEIVPVALGTDTGGSVRVPAALCGVMGLKVSHGAVPLTGVFPLAESLDTVGPIARTVDDLETIFTTIAGFDAADPWSRRVPLDRQDASLSQLTVGVPRAWISSIPTEPEIATAFEAVIADLRAAGARVFDIDTDLAPSPHIVTLSAAEAAGVHREWFTDVDKAYGADVEERLANAMEVTTDQLADARRWQAAQSQAATEAFRSCDVLLTPTVGSANKRIGEDMITIDGQDHFYRPVLSGFTALVNQIWCPALSLPLDTDGAPPPSIQLIADRGHDMNLLAIGRAFEAAGLVAARRAPHSLGA